LCGADTPFGFAQGRLCPLLLTLLVWSGHSCPLAFDFASLSVILQNT
jgi:hypothetical protein